jgi:hypothetical protein
MLGDLEHESAISDIFDLKGIENWGKITFELYIDDSTDNS